MDNEMPEYYAAYFYENFSYIEWNSGDSFMFMYSTDRKNGLVTIVYEIELLSTPVLEIQEDKYNLIILILFAMLNYLSLW